MDAERMPGDAEAAAAAWADGESDVGPRESGEGGAA